MAITTRARHHGQREGAAAHMVFGRMSEKGVRLAQKDARSLATHSSGNANIEC